MNYHKIDICNMDNGDGLRCVIWLSGCNHFCEGCYNKQTWDACSGDPFGEEQWKFIEDALSQDWNSGITFTGGDPLYPMNRKEVQKLCTRIKRKFPKKTIWLYTGYTIKELLKENNEFVIDILKHIDVLVDGPFIETLKSPEKHWVGSSNQVVWHKEEDNKVSWTDCDL
jgi:anaerobic ribonucleoside-triphosphate reductase activating protein